MKQQTVSILIIGGDASAAINLKSRQGYVSRFVHQLQQAGWEARVELHTPVSLDTALPLLYRLNLNRFDLIILQLDHATLQHPITQKAITAATPATVSGVYADNTMASQYGFASAPVAAQPRWWSPWVEWATLGKLKLRKALNRSQPLETVEARLEDLLYYLEPFRRRLVVMTPMPHLHPISGWLRRQGRWLFRQLGRQHLISVFDSASVIQERAEYFDDNTRGNLSSVAHDLLGQALYEFIQINALLPERSKRHPRQH
ncbi:hypothetical protein [Rudanella lutea]|jgi:hypothetical protein|uniref:hypothetical protein n=1 Tax=Rudanella lutea TaxID=451374 RepID=UPI000379E1BE|nr:hypothetical protein [Rudanella lutea]